MAEASTTMGAMDIEKDGKEGEAKKIPVIDPSEDYNLHRLDEYASHAKISRYLFVAERCPTHELEAYKTALAELKKTQNTSLYRKLFNDKKIGEKWPELEYDKAWADSVDQKALVTLEHLEHDLQTARTSLIKESIRMGNIELGNFHYSRGEMSSALRCYVRARDYCNTGQQIIEMCMHVIRVSIETSHYPHVLNYISKAESTPELTDPIIIAKLNACAGLAYLENGKYKQAARKFISVSPTLGDSFSDVILPSDIAVYGGLCALATYDREALKKEVLESKFKGFLELVPTVRTVLEDFYNSQYITFLENLNKLEKDMQLDIHLHDHIQTLYEKIRNKAIVQYFSPFVSVDMKTMASAFKTDVTSLEKELSKLIMDNIISARIDSHNKRLYAKQTEERTLTFNKALAMGRDFEENVKSLLLRVNLVKSDMVVKPRNEKKRKGI